MKYPQPISKKHVTLSLSKSGNRGFVQRFWEGVMLRYSKHGAEGLVRIFTFTTIFCSLISLKALAQNRDTIPTLTSYKFVIKLSDTTLHKYPYFVSGPIVMVDQKMCDSISLNNINSVDVISVVILKYTYKPNVAPCTSHDAVIIVTRPFAISQYQQKFGSFSKDYKAYFSDPKNNEKDFLYVLNGVPVDQTKNDEIKKLYDISPKKIKVVLFKDKGSELGNIKPLVIITTKK